MTWKIFLFLTTIMWGPYNLFFKEMKNNISYFFALLIIGLMQIIVALPFVFHSYLNNDLYYSAKGLLMSAAAGSLLGLGTIFFFYTFKFGAAASIAIPAYGIGALIIGVLGGIVLFNEQISFKIVIGILFGIISIILLTKQ